MQKKLTKSIKVAVRARPNNKREQRQTTTTQQNQQQQQNSSIIKILNTKSLIFDPIEEDDDSQNLGGDFYFQGIKQKFRDITKRAHKNQRMDFDYVFHTKTTNEEIFKECAEPLVDAVLNGQNCSIFVYGATGAGKTYTMLGDNNGGDCLGLAYLTMRDLFEKLKKQMKFRKFLVEASFLEIYNEQVMDLLAKNGKSKPLKLREDSCGDGGGVIVNDLTMKSISSAEELLELLAIGNEKRTQHPTDANAESSRSHAIFQVRLCIVERSSGSKFKVKLSMIDLAGSERAASTNSIGQRFREGANINRGLLALGNCINKLADGLKHIPYRDSNLTRILKDSLGGNCKTVMIANIAISRAAFEDTFNTLKYASRAKKIRINLQLNNLEKENLLHESCQRKVADLNAENERLRRLNETLAVDKNVLEKSMKSLYARILKIEAYIKRIEQETRIMYSVNGELSLCLQKLKMLHFEGNIVRCP